MKRSKLTELWCRLCFGFVRVVAVLSVMVFSIPHVAAFEEVNTGYFDKTALAGYDAVSYFRQTRAIRGEQSFSVEWKGATWLFANEENRKRFVSSPESFVPQYGGYCSNQMSLGNLSDIDPEVWRIIDGRLYLFGHDEGRVRWKSDTQERITDADGHWRDFLER